MSGAPVFSAGVAAGGSGGGEEPNRPCPPKSAHEVNGLPAALRNKQKLAPSRNDDPEEEDYPCHVCHRRFPSVKALHGHVRSHGPAALN
ncbi:hypothetical protein BAE44_0011145 [Dichanthelium oligosanthes]|uniref:C2H2-type domain-containing protein n=1 Tax=Dichanthelium oligosanthes TaxID=888268 RepID=A0A1E5VRW7_9POAL|nr:hypothetical protein BAE44_0011145 [Dichanthelium oligosanthes]